MREKFEICPRIVFGAFEIEGADLAKKDVKEGVLMCR